MLKLLYLPTESCRDDNVNNSLVKSSLVFVLVSGMRQSAADSTNFFAGLSPGNNIFSADKSQCWA